MLTMNAQTHLALVGVVALCVIMVGIRRQSRERFDVEDLLPFCLPNQTTGCLVPLPSTSETPTPEVPSTVPEIPVPLRTTKPTRTRRTRRPRPTRTMRRPTVDQRPVPQPPAAPPVPQPVPPPPAWPVTVGTTSTFAPNLPVTTTTSAPVRPVPPSTAGGFKRLPVFGGYYTSWSTPGPLDQLHPRLDVVCLAFFNANMSWNGGITLDGTGFTYAGGAEKFRQDVAKLRARGTHVLASVGGGAAGDWFNQVQVDRIGSFVETFGLSGVDIDYEPPYAWDKSDAGTKLVTLSRQFRARLPEGRFLLTAATWMNGIDTGNMIPVLQADILDGVFIMSYDTNETPNYADVLAKHRRYSNRVLMLGVETPPEGWGSHVLTLDKVRTVAQVAKTDGKSGVFLWHLSKSDGVLKAPEVINLLGQIL